MGGVLKSALSQNPDKTAINELKSSMILPFNNINRSHARALSRYHRQV